jgi:uncharacterized phage protein gp47/JayE
MTMMRLATAVGTDVDSFVNDFALERMGGAAAICTTVQFSRYTATLAATVNVGVTAVTADGTQGFAVIADESQTYWNAAANAYVIPAGTASASVTMQAQTSGAAGNVPAGSITLLTVQVPYIDYISNTGAAAGGIDAESDAALKLRFRQFIQSLARSTPAAVAFGAGSVQPGLDINLVENYDHNGNWAPGTFFVVVDDGSGSPPASLLSAVATAVALYRGVTTRPSVYGPTVTFVGINAEITVATGYASTAVVGAAVAALTALVNGLKIGQVLYYNAVVQTVMNVAGVVDVTGLTVNAGTSDVTPAFGVGLLRPGTMTVT